MRQRIVHGGTIEAATHDEIGQAVARAFELSAVEDYERKKGVIALDGTGAGVATLAVSAQYDWLMERVTLTGANALVQIFENSQQGTDLLEVVQLGAAGLYSDSFANRLYVTANSQVVVAASGGPANGQVTFNFQIKLRQHQRIVDTRAGRMVTR